MRISDWSSDVCSSDLVVPAGARNGSTARTTGSGSCSTMPRPATSRATWRNRWRRASPDIPPTGLAKGRVRCDRDAYTGGMSDTQLLLLLLVAVCAAIVLLVVLLLRKPGLALEAALREEQRDGRGELRQQLDSLSSAQAQRIEGFGARLTEFSTRTDQRLDVLREALTEDARKARSEGADLQQRFADTLGQRLAELTPRNEQRIGEMRTTLQSQQQQLQADTPPKPAHMRPPHAQNPHAPPKHPPAPLPT